MKKIIIIIILIIQTLNVIGQFDYQNTIKSNPALTGNTNYFRGSIKHLSIYHNKINYKSYLLSADVNLEATSEKSLKNTAIGIYFFKEEFADLENTNAVFIYSYKVPLNEKWRLKFGLGVNFNFINQKPETYIFPDQLQFEHAVLPTSIESFSEEHFFVSFNTGALLSNNYVWLGFSSQDFKPVSYNNNGVILHPVIYRINGGGTIQDYSRGNEYQKNWFLLPNFDIEIMKKKTNLKLAIDFSYRSINSKRKNKEKYYLYAGVGFKTPLKKEFEVFSGHKLSYRLGFTMYKFLTIIISSEVQLGKIDSPFPTHQISLVFENFGRKKYIRSGGIINPIY